MAIEAVAAVAAKEAVAAKAVEAAQQQLIQKLTTGSIEQSRISQSVEQTYATNNFRVGEISSPEIESREIFKQRESDAANELKAKIESIEVPSPDNDLLPNKEYEDNGNHYTTDDLGRTSTWDADLKMTSEERSPEASIAQQEAGGRDRLKNDDGGHLVAHMNGGGSSCENLVPMRDCINRGDYKKCEIEENQMLQEGKSVHESGKVNYEGDSKRPSTIEKSYTDGDKSVEVKFDNREGSTELLENLREDILPDDYRNLVDEISDMKKDGHDVSVTSVKRDYDVDGNLTKVTVGVRDESAGIKEYKTYLPTEGIGK